jgi:hypothetical protein
MINKDVRRDMLLLFCSFLFYFAFFFINVDLRDVIGAENPNFTIGEEPPERCIPRYEDRVFKDEFGNNKIRCVKIAVPENVYYEKSCEELNLTNENYVEECIID